MTGAIYAVQSWSMSATQRRLRPVTERMDHGAYLKMLRNDLYTAHLLDCIRERHVERFPLAVAQPNTGFDRVDVLRSDLSENCGTRAAATPSRDMFSTEIHHNDSTSKTPSQARAARCLPKDFPAC
jgi:hypothetical protein